MKNIYKKINTLKNGFTLVEVVISIGIFVIIAAGSSGVFAMAFKSYRNAKNVNENIKNAQFAVNLMNKTFRTSSIVSMPNSSTIFVFDYSRTSSGCIRYMFSGGNLTESRVNPVGADSATRLNSCKTLASNAATFNAVQRTMTSGAVTGSFNAVTSLGNDTTGASTRVGKVTVMMNIVSGSGATSSSARIQGTASLRDYTEANIGIDPNNPPS